jgi:hypothetical protein
MTSDLDLRALHRSHEPDPAFVDRLRLRVEAAAAAAPGHAEDIDPALGPSVGAIHRRSRRTPVLAAAVVVVLAAVGGAVWGSNDPDEAIVAGGAETTHVGSWVSTDLEGSPLMMVIVAADGSTYEVLIHDDAAAVCSDSPSTMTGTGQLRGDGSLVLPRPELVCDDGTIPTADSGVPPEESLVDFALVPIPGTGELRDSTGVVWRRTDPARPTTTGEEAWTPERTRAEGSPVELLATRAGPSPSGLEVQLYCAGPTTSTGSPCDRYHPYDPAEVQHWALEVTQGERSALFDVQGTPLVRDFDEAAVLVQDGPDQAPRFRLLQADGTAVDLHQPGDLAPAVPGPDVMLVQDLGVYRRGSFGPEGPQEHPYSVDPLAGTLRRLDVPEEIEWWGPNVSELLWGGTGCRVTWQAPDGTFEHHDVECLHGEAGHSDPGWNWPDFVGWLEPDRMALVEWSNDGAPLVVHASLDRGDTWGRVEVAGNTGGTLEGIAGALLDALRQLE